MTDIPSVSSSELLTPLVSQLPGFDTTASCTGRLDFGQQRARQAFQRFVSGPRCSVLFATGLPTWEICQQLACWTAEWDPVLALHEAACHQLADLTGRLATDGTLIPGLFHHARDGLLLLSAADLLTDPRLGEQLFALVQRGHFIPQPAHHRLPADPTLQEPLHVRIIISGQPGQHEALLQRLAGSAEAQHQLMEFASYYPADPEHLGDYLGWLKAWLTQQDLADLTRSAVAYLIFLATRVTEHQQRLTLCFSQLQLVLHEANRLRQQQPCIELAHLEQAYQALLLARNVPAQQSLEAMLQDQVLIETSGRRVGQVNGLSVLEWAHYCFGEPCRLSAVVHVGDGEIADIEHNSELAGNLHNKGVQVLSAWLSAQFGHQDPLPLSASIAFEQSHETVDGDSASLSLLCALLSALADVPLTQGLAITGAVDQSGQVMAVGGINEKIEGFFNLCRARDLDGQQGVILPKANLRSLALPQPIRDAVSVGQFHIYPVSRVEQALALLSGIAIDARDDRERYLSDSVYGQIERRLRQLHELETTPRLWQRLKMGLEDLLKRE